MIILVKLLVSLNFNPVTQHLQRGWQRCSKILLLTKPKLGKSKFGTSIKFASRFKCSRAGSYGKFSSLAIFFEFRSSFLELVSSINLGLISSESGKNVVMSSRDSMSAQVESTTMLLKRGIMTVVEPKITGAPESMGSLQPVISTALFGVA